MVPVLRQVDAWLEQAVRSALDQTVPSEVVVVTAPATPSGNRAVLARLQREAPDRLVVGEVPAAGYAAALNLGFRTARGARVGLLLSDDWLAPTAVEAGLGVDADIVSTWMQSYAEDGVTEFAHLRKEIRAHRFAALPTLEAKADYLSHFFLLRRACVLAIGGADETLGDTPGIDDYDLIWVLLEHGASVSIVERFLYHRRDHAGDRLTTRPATEMLATLGRILDKHGVAGAEREHLLARKARWFGEPVHVAAARLGWRPGKNA